MPKVSYKAFSIIPALIAAAGLCAAAEAQADTTAVTPTGSSSAGFVSGAVGFSFTPTTNLTVTSVGYLDYGDGAPVIRFWSDTNYVFASFALPPGTHSATMIYSNVSLTLLAGQRYTVTVEDASATPLSFNYYTSFQAAPELANYTAQIYSSGSFADNGAGYYFQGPDFLYTNQAASVTSPQLTILQQSSTNVLLRWPASPSGFVLQDTPSLDAPIWAVLTNAMTTVNGTNEVSDVIGPGNSFYRLYHP